MSIHNQPKPIILHIFHFLLYPQHLKLRSVCKFYLNLINSEEISGVAPRNIFECVLLDKIYHFYLYIKIFDKYTSSFIPNQQYYYNKYGDYKIGYVFYIFCKKYMPNSIVHKYLCKNKYYYPVDDNILDYLFEINIINNDPVVVQKIVSIVGKVKLSNNIQRLLVGCDDTIKSLFK